MTIHCFYHGADLDGQCSGAIIKHRYPEAVLHPVNYSDPFLWEIIEPEDRVYVVDYHLQPFSDMLRLSSACHLTWIDHHISAIREYEASGQKIECLLDARYAACELTWMYFFGEEDMPEFIHLLGRYDVWDHSDPARWDDYILPFQYGLRLEDADPSRNWEFWDLLFQTALAADPDGTLHQAVYEATIEQGQVILAYLKQSNAHYMRALAYEIQWEGLNALAVNKGLSSSMDFESTYNPARHDIMIAYSHLKGRRWVVSLYSDNPEVDCAAIAKRHGGGGHKGAAGFSCDELPFIAKEAK
ncbi:MAG TPA: hypothetical protein VN455_14785 [Methanotrichaceae archaeon]|nr:hypothetical protein [Methanotrichaceae archaeon]